MFICGATPGARNHVAATSVVRGKPTDNTRRVRMVTELSYTLYDIAAMAQYPHTKQKRNDHLLKNLPSEVLLKARTTLFSLSGALKSKHEHSSLKHESKDKKNQNTLKNSLSEPEFRELRSNRRRSRADGNNCKDYAGARPRPKSMGPLKRHDDLDEFQAANENQEVPSRLRQFDSSEDVCVQSRLVIPVIDRFGSQELHDTDRPRKKLSFREPEIVPNNCQTLGRSNKLMGVNSLSRRPNRLSLRAEVHSSSVNGLDSDLESQAMRIVRTVGQAFEVCHKMQINTPEQAAASASSAADDLAFSDRASDLPPAKEAVSDCGASEASAASTSKGVVEVVAEEKEPPKERPRPTHLELLPPPPRKSDRRTPQLPNFDVPEQPDGVAEQAMAAGGDAGEDPALPLSTQHQVQLLEERLENQTQQTRAAVAQVFVLRDQLAVEKNARYEAQARTHQLLVHNKELLEHIAALVAHLRERERGAAKPINAQQLTLLPQKTGAEKKAERACNGNAGNGQPNVDTLIDLINDTKISQNVANNNAPVASSALSSPPSFGNMTNEQIQNYLIEKFQHISTNTNDDLNNDDMMGHSPFYQNRNAFPNIPPVINDYNYADLENFLGVDNNIGQAMSVGQSENSLCSASQATTSKDSTPDAFSSDDSAPFIMPLSHNGTLTATGEDGRVRLIVPVSPSPSTSDVPETPAQPEPPAERNSLTVPMAYTAPITRSRSEKVANHSQMMTALRQQWTRHTTK